MNIERAVAQDAYRKRIERIKRIRTWVSKYYRGGGTVSLNSQPFGASAPNRAEAVFRACELTNDQLIRMLDFLVTDLTNTLNAL